jgi:hypothetical protein
MSNYLKTHRHRLVALLLLSGLSAGCQKGKTEPAPDKQSEGAEKTPALAGVDPESKEILARPQGDA